jgi:uncharacterized membrane protein
MEWLHWLRWAHILGACVLIGTGAGIAFFMLMAHRTRNAAAIAHVASTVVIADLLFTATAVVVQPVTGILLAIGMGWPLTSRWILWSIALYLFIGLCWLPVVWIQIQLRNLAREAVATGDALTPRYLYLYRWWFALGWPAFAAIVAILALMIVRPV